DQHQQRFQARCKHFGRARSSSRSRRTRQRQSRQSVCCGRGLGRCGRCGRGQDVQILVQFQCALLSAAFFHHFPAFRSLDSPVKHPCHPRI
ncbi:hypothetical protein EDD21DRAFT_448793, partial [Dissophora ornata]